MFDVDFHDLERFHGTIEQLEKDFPKEAKQMMLKVGNKVKRIIYKKAVELVNEKSGRYWKSIKRGKVWNENGQLTVRVYSTDNKKFWIEHGHRIVTKDGKEVGFTRGKKVFERSAIEVKDHFRNIVETELERVFEKLR